MCAGTGVRSVYPQRNGRACERYVAIGVEDQVQRFEQSGSPYTGKVGFVYEGSVYRYGGEGGIVARASDDLVSAGAITPYLQLGATGNVSYVLRWQPDTHCSLCEGHGEHYDPEQVNTEPPSRSR